MRRKIFAEYVGRMLRETRGKKTQAEFARELGITHQPQYWRYESGKNMPPRRVLEKAAELRGLSFDDFVGLIQFELEQDLEDRQGLFGEFYLSREEISLLSRYQALKERDVDGRFIQALDRFMNFWRIGDPVLLDTMDSFLTNLQRLIDKFPMSAAVTRKPVEAQGGDQLSRGGADSGKKGSGEKHE